MWLSALCQAHTCSWRHHRLLWCFLLLLLLPSSFPVFTPKPARPSVMGFFSGFCLRACPDSALNHYSLSPHFSPSSPSFSPSPSPFFSPCVPVSAAWIPLPLSLSVAVYGAGKSVPWMDSLLLANGSRPVSLCKYLHRGIIDGPTHSRWSSLCSRPH